MKAIVQEGYGSADVLRLQEIDRPQLLDDRVLVRVRAASVNALDWHLVHGLVFVRATSGWRRPKTPVRGVDLAGIVEAVGPKVTAFKAGDEVFGQTVGAFAEYARARESALVHKPRGLSFQEAATVNVAGQTALQGLRDIGGVKAGDRVLIYGAGGGVGTFAVQIAKALGAHVTAVTSERNLELVRSLGPDEVIDYTKEDPTRRGQRYDVILDVAATRSIGDLRRLLKPAGTLVLTGAAKSGAFGVLTRVAAGMFRSRVLKQRVRFFVAQVRQEDLALLKQMIESGKLRPAIDRRYPLAQVPDAVRYLGSGQARAKVVIDVSES